SDGYLVNEIVALIGALERTFHTEFSREAFMRSVELYRRARSLAAELEQSVARGDLSFSRFASVLQWNHVLPVEDQITRLELLRSETEDETLAKRRFRPTATVVISGILPPMEEISEMIEDAGLRVVGNDVASMRRSYGYTPPVADEPGAYYVDLYGNHYPCTTLLHTADERIERLVGLVEQTGADGFLFAGVKYCENEYFELPLCREVLEQRGVPTLDLEFTVGDRRNLATYRTRIEAFAEMLDSNHGDA
ncbi:MAG: 2-hydroxyacyl-CoA dehydratase family protein, partial [Deltaproteobacteria bacterium]